jgi:hypothetical protein
MVFSLLHVAWAKSPLTRTEKAQLQYHHSIMKKHSFVMKRSSLNSIQAKMKEKNKVTKKSRAEASI